MFSQGDGANFEFGSLGIVTLARWLTRYRFMDIGGASECLTVVTSALNVGSFKSQSLNTLNGKIVRINRFTGQGMLPVRLIPKMGLLRLSRNARQSLL